jgi:N-acetylmuramic acid 6-phosphate etherase
MTVAVVNVPESPLARASSVAIVLRTGAEPIMGSTRMRAGLAQRLWLTVFSTATMTRLGLTHDNLMVNVAPALAKLRERRLAILSELTGGPREDAAELLDRAGDDLRVAIVMTEAGVDHSVAGQALSAVGGRTRAAIERLGRA